MHPVVTALAASPAVSKLLEQAAREVLPLVRRGVTRGASALSAAAQGTPGALIGTGVTASSVAAPWFAGGAFAAGVATGWLTAPRAGRETRRRLRARGRLFLRNTRQATRARGAQAKAWTGHLLHALTSRATPVETGERVVESEVITSSEHLSDD